MGVSGIGKPLKLRLFLEGQEVPVISATVSIGYNGPAVASVQILPIDEGLTFKPRTMVHLFFLDELPTDGRCRTYLVRGCPSLRFLRELAIQAVLWRDIWLRLWANLRSAEVLYFSA